MSNVKLAKAVFGLSAIYDFILGMAFLLVPSRIFDYFQVGRPNHLGYVQFSALLLIVFALMFFQVASDPRANVKLMPYGVLLKASYSLLVICYWIFASIPGMWKPFAVVDLVFMILFGWCYLKLLPAERATS